MPFARLRRVPAALWGLLALGTGMALGALFPGPLSIVASGVSAAFQGISAAAPYVIFFTVAAAIIDMLRKGHAGRFAIAVSATFVAIGLVASLLAILLAVPLYGLSWSGGGAARGLVAPGETLGQVVATHLTQSLVAVLYAIVASVAVHHLARWRPAARAANATLDVVRYVGVEGMSLLGRGIRVAFPLLLLAVGIFVPASISKAVGAAARGLGGSAPLQTAFGSHPLGVYLVVLWVQLVAYAVFMVGATALVCWTTGFPVRRFVREYLALVYPFAWATASSAACIPVNLERTEALGVRKEVRDFVIPLGATVNLDGTVMASFIITPMAAMLVGYRPTFVDLLLLVIPIKLVTMGVPGIPGGIAVVVPPVVADVLPIPSEARSAFLALWFAFSVGLSDQFRTGVNTTTNGLVAIVFERLYPRWFEKRVAPAPAGEPQPEPATEA